MNVSQAAMPRGFVDIIALISQLGSGETLAARVSSTKTGRFLATQPAFGKVALEEAAVPATWPISAPGAVPAMRLSAKTYLSRLAANGDNKIPDEVVHELQRIGVN